MGKTHRKSLHRIRYQDFETFFAEEYGDWEKSLAKFGRGFGKKSLQDIHAIWKRAGRDGQRDFKEETRLPFSCTDLDPDRARQHARGETKRALHRGIRSGEWEDIIFPNRRSEKAKAVAGID